jgi:hypothetical protein
MMTAAILYIFEIIELKLSSLVDYKISTIIFKSPQKCSIKALLIIK